MNSEEPEMRIVFLFLSLIIQSLFLFTFLYLAIALLIWTIITRMSLYSPPWPILNDGKLSSSVIQNVHLGAASLGALLSIFINFWLHKHSPERRAQGVRIAVYTALLVFGFGFFGKDLFHIRESWERHPSRLYVLKEVFGPRVDACAVAKISMTLEELRGALKAGTIYDVTGSQKGAYCAKESHCTALSFDGDHRLAGIECWDGSIQGKIP